MLDKDPASGKSGNPVELETSRCGR